MNKNRIIIVVAVVLLVGGLWYWFAGSKGSVPNNAPVSATSTPSPSPAPVSSGVSSRARTAPAPAASTTILASIEHYAFSPATLTIHKGTTVTWTNLDLVFHTVTGDNNDLSSSPLSQGQSYSYTFNTIGSFSYHCSTHPSMKGVVRVIR